MKTKQLFFASLIIVSATLSGCGHSGTRDTEGNPAATEKMNENEGNHANTPNTAPGTNYPESAERDSLAKDSTRMHHSK